MIRLAAYALTLFIGILAGAGMTVADIVIRGL